MATDTMTRGAVQARKIPIRTITSDDLRFALRQGLDDFLAMRGDILLGDSFTRWSRSQRW